MNVTLLFLQKIKFAIVDSMNELSIIIKRTPTTVNHGNPPLLHHHYYNELLYILYISAIIYTRIKGKAD